MRHTPIQIDKPKRGLAWGLGALALSAVATAAYEFSQPAPPPEHTAAAPRATQPLAAAAPFSSDPPALIHTATAEALSAKLDRLARGTPAENLEAVKILQACQTSAALNRTRNLGDEAQLDPAVRKAIDAWAAPGACEGIAPGQRTQYLPLALKAAEAAIPGGFAALRWALNVGGEEARTDPLVQQSFEHILAVNLKAADPDALIGRFSYETNCADEACKNYDPRAGLVHWTAYVDTGRMKRPDTITPRLAQELGTEVAQAAIAEGHSLYANRGQQ